MDANLGETEAWMPTRAGLSPHSEALIHRIRKFPFGTNGSRMDTICRFRPDRNIPSNCENFVNCLQRLSFFAFLC